LNCPLLASTSPVNRIINRNEPIRSPTISLPLLLQFRLLVPPSSCPCNQSIQSINQSDLLPFKSFPVCARPPYICVVANVFRPASWFSPASCHRIVRIVRLNRTAAGHSTSKGDGAFRAILVLSSSSCFFSASSNCTSLNRTPDLAFSPVDPRPLSLSHPLVLGAFDSTAALLFSRRSSPNDHVYFDLLLALLH